MNKDLLNKCYEPFEIRTRQGFKGQTYSYISSKDIIHRMNTVFSGNWCTEVLFQNIIEDQLILRVRVTIRNTEDGELYSHEGYGSHHIARYTSGPNQNKIIDIGNTYKSAFSKAVVNACRMWGVGLFFEDPNMAADDDSDITSVPSLNQFPVVDVAPQAKAPSLETAIVEPPVIEPEPVSVIYHKSSLVGGTPSESVSAPVISQPNAVHSAPQQTPQSDIPIMAIPHASALPEVNIPKLNTPQINSSPIMTPSKNFKESKPTESMVGPAKIETHTATEELPFSVEEAKINDVQKVAINGILSLRKMTYDQLATEAFANIGLTDYSYPPLDQLSYNEAVILIKYGNNKFRK